MSSQNWENKINESGSSLAAMEKEAASHLTFATVALTREA
jgi:hypothetical protein